MTDLPSTPREALEQAAQCVEASRLAGGRSSLEAFKATKKEIAAVIRAIPVAEPVPVEAKLAAAAPDLLAALQHIIGGALSLPRFAEIEARAAIAKALGTL